MPGGRPRGRTRGSTQGRATAGSARGGRAQQANAEESGSTEAVDAPTEATGAVEDATVASESTDRAAAASSSTSSTQPQPMPTTTAPALAPATRARGQSSTARGATTKARGVVGSKFKPRAVRRADADRERIAQEEIRKQSLKLAEDQRVQRARSGRGRGGRARGRGDAMGRGGSYGRNAETGNAFFGNPGVVSSGFGKATGSAFKLSYRDRANRLNADMFHGATGEYMEDEDDESKGAAASGAASSSSNGPITKSTTPVARKRDIMPMGILRREAPPKEVIVATTAEMEAQEQQQHPSATATHESSSGSTPATGATDVDMKDNGQVWPGMQPGERKVKIKDTKGDDVVVTDIDDTRLDPEVVNKKITAAAPGSSSRREVVAPKTEDEGKKKKKRAGDTSREAEIRAEQRAMMLKEFGSRADSESRDGRMYLFQFPPIMPPLRVVSRPKKNPRKDVVKKEPVDDEEDVVTMDIGSTVDLTNQQDDDDSPGQKRRQGEKEDEDEDDDPDPENPYPSVVGYVGKMQVRRSGRVTIDWGGIPFSITPGIQTSFLTNAVLLEQSDQKTAAKVGKPGGEVCGKAYGMGKVMGRFVCRPVWSDPEPWVVGEEEVEAARREVGGGG